MTEPQHEWRSLAVDFVADTAIVVHAPCEPLDDDWRRVMEILAERSSAGRLKACLIFHSGARPTPLQRSQIATFLRGSGARAAVITDSALTRGAVTALRWLGAPIRAFAPDDYDAAAPFVSLSQVQIEQAGRIAREIEDRLRQVSPRLFSGPGG